MGSTERPVRPPTRSEFNEDLWFYTKSELVLGAARRVDRRQFLSSKFRDKAYEDSVVQLVKGCSLSEPSLVVQMIDELRLKGNERVLEIGTGTGYEAAVLSLCAQEVYTVDFNERLVHGAQKKLRCLGYLNVEAVVGDGCLGLPDRAPFDAIIVSAAAREVPRALVDQLSVGGRFVIPVGYDPEHCRLKVGVKQGQGFLLTHSTTFVSFHPLMSEHAGGWTEEKLQELLGKKVAYLSRRIDERAQQPVRTRQEILAKWAEELNIDPLNEEEILRVVAKALEVPRSEIEE